MTKPTLIVTSIFGVLCVIAAAVASQAPNSLSAPNALSSLLNTPGTLIAKESDLPILSPRMPNFQGITKWWNTADGQQLTPDGLKGKVVLVDFWTYSCINCIRTYPFLKTMQERYADKGLVIVGVHTPEFGFEADQNNVEHEIQKNGLKYPIALDPVFGTWNAYHNQYWPAEYLFDRQGRLRRTHFGEGEYDQNEAAIRTLLSEAPVELQPMGEAVPTPDLSNINTPETYFGLARGEAFMGHVPPAQQDTVFHQAAAVDVNKWTAEGTWKFEQEYIQADSANAVFRFNVQADMLHIVMESADGKDKTIEVSIDGGSSQKMIINASTLYTLARFPQAGRHVVQINVLDPGVRFYAATFS